MTTSTPLSALPLPPTDEGWEEWLAQRCDGQLELARTAIEQLKADPGADAATVLARWNDASIALGNAFAAASLMSQVHPREAVRTRAEAAEQAAHKLSTDLSLDRALFDILAAVDADALDEGGQRVLRLTLRDFRRSGVDRDEATRERLRALAERETLVGQEFSKNIRDDVRRVHLEPGQLAGMPQDWVDAHPVGGDGRVEVSTDYPDVVPFMSFAHDHVARAALRTEFLNRAWPANDGVLKELLALRAEHASLLGYDGWPDYDAEVKMIGRGAAIEEFIDEIAALAGESGRRDVAVLLARLQQDRPGDTTVAGSDAAYYAEVIRRENFDVDAQTVRTYFDFAAVRQGLLDVTGRLFGLDYRRVEDAPAWHEDVAVYDVLLDGEAIGRIHLDLHPREGKYKHAAQFDLQPGIAGRQLAEGVLVCNFPRGLMEHSDVVTLFHEFGHLVHHVLAGRHTWARFSGVATEWDFVEAPSQMLEEWAWDATVLRTFARNAAGEPIPAELVARMKAADDFGKGYLARTQMFYAAVSYRLHRERVEDTTALVRSLQEHYDLFPYTEGTHFQAAFGHLEGYSSAYYTYMWSLVIAKDLFSAFDKEDLFADATALRYRDRILAAGGSKDAADLVEDFLGRPYSPEAFRRWLEEAPRA
ncbi:MAG: M3 family metallopeptidase [Oryzihumus sp.]